MRPLNALEQLPVSMAARLTSGRGRNASLLVLIYHRVLAEPDPLLPYEPDAVRFATQMDILTNAFSVLPLQDAWQRLQSGTLPARAVCISFDDGYANNHDVALPILLKKGIPATVFVAPGFLNGGRMFNDTVIESVRRAPADTDLAAFNLPVGSLDSPGARVNAYGRILQCLKFLEPLERQRQVDRLAHIAQSPLPTNLMMTTAQVVALHRAGVEIGAHTMLHPILSSANDEVARSEIFESKQVLEQMLGAPVRSFAYPNGLPNRDYGDQHVQMVRQAGFSVALSTAWGAADRNADALQIPRVSPWDRTALRFGLRLALAYRQRRPAVAAS
jgi:peptidoglycan/xylan/chitin deacetylase (PgdA/CDA1 family)